MARRGLNTTLSYADGRTARKYRLRGKALTYGYEQIAEEDEARRTKAFYPHRTAPTRFAVTVDLIGQAERRSLNRYLMRYFAQILDPGQRGPNIPLMTVEMPSRNFVRTGVPVAGIEFGTHIGEMVFSPTLVFETSGEPLDWKQVYAISRARLGGARKVDPTTAYFYPNGVQEGAVPGSDLDNFDDYWSEHFGDLVGDDLHSNLPDDNPVI